MYFNQIRRSRHISIDAIGQRVGTLPSSTNKPISLFKWPLSSALMEFYYKRLLEKASQDGWQGFGCSRKCPKMLGKVADAPDYTAMEFYSKRMYPKGPLNVKEAFGCSRKVLQKLERLSGSPLFHPCGILFQAAVMATFPSHWDNLQVDKKGLLDKTTAIIRP